MADTSFAFTEKQLSLLSNAASKHSVYYYPNEETLSIDLVGGADQYRKEKAKDRVTYLIVKDYAQKLARAGLSPRLRRNYEGVPLLHLKGIPRAGASSLNYDKDVKTGGPLFHTKRISHITFEGDETAGEAILSLKPFECNTFLDPEVVRKLGERFTVSQPVTYGGQALLENISLRDALLVLKRHSRYGFELESQFELDAFGMSVEHMDCEAREQHRVQITRFGYFKNGHAAVRITAGKIPEIHRSDLLRKGFVIVTEGEEEAKRNLFAKWLFEQLTESEKERHLLIQGIEPTELVDVYDAVSSVLRLK